MSSEYSNALLAMMAEKEAKRVSYHENTLTGEKILVRKFSAPSDADEANGIQFASRYVSMNNYDTGSETHSLFNYVDDPLCDNVKFTGRWIIVAVDKASVKIGAGQQGVVETLISGTASQLSVEGFKLFCDTVMNVYVALRATAAEVTTFISAHATPTSPSTSMIGVTRSETHTDRGNGFWDVVITERITTYDEDKHYVSVVTHRGLSQETTTVKIFNVPLDTGALNLETYLAALNIAGAADTPTAAKRITEAQITRQDNCTFDAVYQIVTFIAGSSAVYQIMDDGIVRKYGKRYWNQYKDPTATPVASQPSVAVVTADWPAAGSHTPEGGTSTANEQKVDIAQLDLFDVDIENIG